MRFQENWGKKEGGRLMGFIIGSMDLQYSNTHRIEDKFVQNLILMLIHSSGHKIYISEHSFGRNRLDRSVRHPRNSNAFIVNSRSVS